MIPALGAWGANQRQLCWMVHNPVPSRRELDECRWPRIFQLCNISHLAFVGVFLAKDKCQSVLEDSDHVSDFKGCHANPFYHWDEGLSLVLPYRTLLG